MTRTNNTYEITEDEFADTISDDDYIFVIDSKGNLKSLLIPEEVDMEIVPDKVQKVMDICGIVSFQNFTVH